MAGTIKSLGKSIADWSREKVEQSKENHVLDLMVELKDEGITFEEYAETYKKVSDIRKDK